MLLVPCRNGVVWCGVVWCGVVWCGVAVGLVARLWGWWRGSGVGEYSSAGLTRDSFAMRR